ncbi:MAG: hypothetical protein ACI94Y_004317, partial [Maribacter sp.]
FLEKPLHINACHIRQDQVTERVLHQNHFLLVLVRIILVLQILL